MAPKSKKDMNGEKNTLESSEEGGPSKKAWPRSSRRAALLLKASGGNVRKTILEWIPDIKLKRERPNTRRGASGVGGGEIADKKRET